MKLYKFEPGKYESEDEKKKKSKPLKSFSGYVMLQPPTFDECMGYMEDCGLDIEEDEKKKKTPEERKADTKKNMKQARQMVKLSETHYKEVSLKHDETGVEYKSFLDLSVSPECRGLLTIVGALVVKGFGPSKH